MWASVPKRALQWSLKQTALKKWSLIRTSSPPFFRDMLPRRVSTTDKSMEIRIPDSSPESLPVVPSNAKRKWIEPFRAEIPLTCFAHKIWMNVFTVDFAADNCVERRWFCDDVCVVSRSR